MFSLVESDDAVIRMNGIDGLVEHIGKSVYRICVYALACLHDISVTSRIETPEQYRVSIDQQQFHLFSCFNLSRNGLIGCSHVFQDT